MEVELERCVRSRGRIREGELHRATFHGPVGFRARIRGGVVLVFIDGEVLVIELGD